MAGRDTDGLYGQEGDDAPAAPDLGSPVTAPVGRSPRYLVYLVVLLTLSNALSYADRQVFAILLPSIKTAFGASDATMGLLGGPAFVTAYVALCLPLAALADRTSRRRVLAFSVIVWTAATAWCGMAANVAQFTLGRIGVGIGEAGGSPPAQSLIASNVPARYLSTALGVFTTGTYIGVAAGMWGGAALESEVGWRQTFLILALPGIPVAALILATLPKREPIPGQRASSHAAMPLIAVIRRCWAIRSLRLLTLGAGTMNIFGYAAGVWMPSYLVRSHGMTLVQAGFWNGVASSVGGFAGSLIGGALADRLSARDPRRQLLLPAAGLLMAAPFFAAQLLWPSDWTGSLLGYPIPLVALFSLPASLCMSLWMPAGFAAVQNVVPQQMRAQAAAMLIVILFLIGGMTGPIFIGVTSDALASRFGAEALRYSLLLGTVALLVGATLFVRAARHYPSDRMA